jgi:hypothetical protein
MKRMIIIAGLAAAVAVAAWPTFAQPGPQRGGQAAGREAPAPQPLPPPGRPADMRERDVQAPRKATLTPEERRDLRRDIQQHGREVYRDPPDRRPRR